MKVWEEGKLLAVEVYKLTSTGDFYKDFGLRDQIRRAAVSIPSNIAEGDELQTNKQGINHFYHAKGSTAELITQLLIAKEVGYINESDCQNLIDKAQKVAAMLNKLIQARALETKHLKPITKDQLTK